MPTVKRKNTSSIESDVNKILKGDGIDIVEVDNIKMQTVTRLSELKARFPVGKTWAKRVVNTFNSAFFNSATLICQNKGEGCRRHKHPDCDEFWIIMSGKIKFEIGENKEPNIVSQGDIVYLPKGTAHKVIVVSDEPSIRFSISVEAMRNIYYE